VLVFLQAFYGAVYTKEKLQGWCHLAITQKWRGHRPACGLNHVTGPVEPVDYTTPPRPVSGAACLCVV
jgi:hypothetical protein